MNDNNFMESPAFLVYLAAIMGLLFLMPDHETEILVLGAGVGLFLEGRRGGWSDPSIVWPPELALVAKCYYGSLFFIKIATVLSLTALIYLLWDGLLASPDFFTIGGRFYIICCLWIFSAGSLLSLAWMLHDRWAKAAGSVTIKSLNPPFTYGIRGFRTISWMLADIIVGVALFILWYNELYLHAFDLFGGTVLLTVFYGLFIPCKYAMYFHFNKELKLLTE